MKKKKILTYVLSGLVPLLIFFVCASILGFIPAGDNQLNIYDSFTQYPGILLEYAHLLKSGHLFYSFDAGLGFNFYGTFTYYAASPLNLLALFANQTNYPFFIAAMTYLRFVLLGISMCFYLDHKGTKPVYTVLFSTAYSLMGYTAAYYYNYLWIDSIIMLPLVIHGLDKLIDKDDKRFYIISLALTIFINYYIGYMICLFALIYFIYRLISKENKKRIIKSFIISSLLSGFICAFTILPSVFALLTGKAELYETINYGGLNSNGITFFYSPRTGTYQTSDQMNGPAEIYSSILVLVLTIFYFFNTKYSKKEKIATLIVLLFFYLSFTVNALNYAWQLFQKPIWWPSRFSFVFSFFIITLAADVISNIDKTKFQVKWRVLISIIFFALVFVGAYVKWKTKSKIEIYTYFYLFLSFILFMEAMLLLDKKGFIPLLIAFSFIDISVNTFNDLKLNSHYQSYIFYSSLKADLPKTIEDLNSENEYFYRFELMDDYTSDDGLYFNYHGINYFNSARNIKVVDTLSKLGLKVTDRCHVNLNVFDPVFLSLFNIKYLYGKMDYFEALDNQIYENPYPLSIGFIGSEDIKDVKLNDTDTYYNLENIVSTLTGMDAKLYEKYTSSEFQLEEFYLNEDGDKLIHSSSEDGSATFTFKSDGDYLVMPNKSVSYKIKINGEEINNDSYYHEINKGDTLEVTYKLYNDTVADNIYVYLLNIENYESAMKTLSQNLLYAKENQNGHILEGTINVTTDNHYLFTSVEYEDGMKVYVDGEEVTPDIILDAFIGLDLTPGEHSIYIDYTPKGFKTGCTISFISLILTGIYLQKSKKNL